MSPISNVCLVVETVEGESSKPKIQDEGENLLLRSEYE